MEERLEKQKRIQPEELLEEFQTSPLLEGSQAEEFQTLLEGGQPEELHTMPDGIPPEELQTLPDESQPDELLDGSQPAEAKTLRV